VYFVFFPRYPAELARLAGLRLLAAGFAPPFLVCLVEVSPAPLVAKGFSPPALPERVALATPYRMLSLILKILSSLTNMFMNSPVKNGYFPSRL